MKIGGISGLMRQLLMLLMAICFIHNSGAVGLYSPQTVIKCEDDPTDFDINCFPDHVYILSAFFGRDDSTTCTTASTAATTTMCSTTPANAGSAVSWMNDIFTPMCNGQTTCNLAMANVNAFASSTECAGVYKFLRVTYMCITPGDTNPTPKPTTVAINQQPATTQLNPLSAESPKVCECDVIGDPIVNMMDKQTMSLLYPSKTYLVSQLSATNGHIGCGYGVWVRLGAADPTTGIIVPDEVTVAAKDSSTDAILAFTSSGITNRGIAITSPKVIGQIAVEPYLGGNIVRFLSCGGLTIQVKIAGVGSKIFVKIPTVAGPAATGLCGNCDGKQNDYKLRDGTSVAELDSKFGLIGQSYEEQPPTATIP